MDRSFGWMLVLVALLFTGCATSRYERKLGNIFNTDTVFKQHHVGFALADVRSGKMLYQKDAEKYYTPASNAKLFTFYAGLKLMPDSVPALRYIEKGDSLIFWGTGDPSLLRSGIKAQPAYQLLKHTDKQLFFSSGRYTGEAYGYGWQMDDYDDNSQAEVNELPLMGNLAHFYTDASGKLKVEPAIFTNRLKVDSTFKPSAFTVRRAFDSNDFVYPAMQIPANFKQDIPYKITATLSINILSDTLHKAIGLLNRTMPADAKTIYGTKSDTLFKRMLQPSDNFIAEQLILLYANNMGQEMNTVKTLNSIVGKLLPNLPDKPRWVDGSGLSRGDLFTPRSIIALLKKIFDMVNNEQRLFGMLAAGGKTGTLKNAYPKTDTPFVFAKTGTLSNNYSQSGYIITKSGKILAYSFMNNNYLKPTSVIRNEMAKIMTMVHDNF